MKKRDDAASAVLAFILILAGITAAAGLWAVLVLPDELHTKQELEAEAALSSLTDVSFTLQALPAVLYDEPVSVSRALPKGTLQTEDCGVLILNGNISIPLRSLTFSCGDSCVIGLVSSGVWRKDGDSAAWRMFPNWSFDAGVLKLDVPVFTGDAVFGSSAYVPVRIGFTGSVNHTVSGSAVSLSVISADVQVLQLFETAFREAAFSLPPPAKADIRTDSGQVSAVFSADDGVFTIFAEELHYQISPEVLL